MVNISCSFRIRFYRQGAKTGSLLAIIGHDSDSLRHLNAGSLAKTAADTARLDMRLFKITNRYGNLSKRAGAGAYTAGVPLKRQAQAFINMRMPHLYVFKDIFPYAFDRLQRPRRAGIPALHAQDTGLLARSDIGCSHSGNTLLKTEILDAIVRTNLRTFPAANTAAQKFILRQGPGRTKKTHAVGGNPARRPCRTRYGCKQCQHGCCASQCRAQESPAIHWSTNNRAGV